MTSWRECHVRPLLTAFIVVACASELRQPIGMSAWAQVDRPTATTIDPCAPGADSQNGGTIGFPNTAVGRAASEYLLAVNAGEPDVLRLVRTRFAPVSDQEAEQRELFHLGIRRSFAPLRAHVAEATTATSLKFLACGTHAQSLTLTMAIEAGPQPRIQSVSIWVNR